MFATPRAGTDSHRGSGTRRALQMGSVSRQSNSVAESECPSESEQAPNDTSSEVLTILRSLQQQVSSLQAQQQQAIATQTRAEASTQLPKRTPKEKRKTPKELLVKLLVIRLCKCCKLILLLYTVNCSPNNQASSWQAKWSSWVGPYYLVCYHILVKISVTLLLLKFQ